MNSKRVSSVVLRPGVTRKAAPNDWDAGPEGYWADLREGFGISDEAWEHIPGSSLREVIELLLRTWDGVYRGTSLD